MKKKLYYYDIELRDKDGKLYVNSNGNKLASRTFQFTDETEEDFIYLVCKNTAENYIAVCKEGTEVNIEVRTLDAISDTYPIVYSFYGGQSPLTECTENKFVKH